jgi:hypothetical protein
MAKQNRNESLDRGSREKGRAQKEPGREQQMPSDREQIRGQGDEYRTPPKPKRQPGQLPLPD